VARDHARLLVDRGDWAAARDRLAASTPRTVPRPADAADWYGLLGRIAAGTGRHAAAPRYAAAAVRAAARTDSPAVQATALLDRARVLHAIGDRRAAAAAAAAGARFHRKGHRPGVREAARMTDLLTGGPSR
jgi:hypothetical protein